MKVGIIVNPTKQEYFSKIEEFVDWLLESKNEVMFEESKELTELNGAEAVNREVIGQESDVIAVFGGDGTLLDASHEMVEFDAPILGINTGGLGFLTETSINEVKESFTEILSDNYELQNRMLLKVDGPEEDGKLLALNDMVLSRNRLGRVFEVSAYVDGSFVTEYVCDGMIVSTPTGSTAYNLSANGPIVHSEVESIILNPICPHTLTNRPLIIPPSSEVRLQIESSDECLITADGQDKITGLKQDDSIVIKRSEKDLTLINPGERDFYHILRNKLHWSGQASTE